MCILTTPTTTWPTSIAFDKTSARVNAMGSIPKDVSARHSHSNGESPQACVTWKTKTLLRCCQ